LPQGSAFRLFAKILSILLLVARSDMAIHLAVLLSSAFFARQAAGHAWVTSPMSRNEMTQRIRGTWPAGMPQDFRYEPQSSANGNLAGKQQDYPGASCGARSAEYASGLNVWQKWYDAAGLSVPTLRPGSRIDVSVRFTADHMGQAWFQVACGTEITENVNWFNLPYSGGGNFKAWRRASQTQRMSYIVPADFRCPTEMAVGRWLWKTGNSCNDFNNQGRKTETFERSSETSSMGVCPPGVNPEQFISCFDFRGTWNAGPAPAPQPTPAPPSPTPAPPTGPCRHQTDCSVSAWCNSPSFEQWCQQQGSAGSCPSPQCTTDVAAVAEKKASFFMKLRR